MDSTHNYLKINNLILSLQLFGALILCSSIGLGFALYNAPKPEQETTLLSHEDHTDSSIFPDKGMYGQAQKGRELFENNCASCHNIHRVMVGPALKGITTRRDMKWIVKWVQNPSKVLASKDPYALKLAADFGPAGIMPGFPALKQKDIENIVAYISTEQTQVPY